MFFFVCVCFLFGSKEKGDRAMKKRTPGGCLGDLLGILIPSYIRMILRYYKDPYLRTSRMENKRGFFRGSMGN